MVVLVVCECETLNISRLMASLVTQGFMIRSYDAPNDAGRGSLWPSLRFGPHWHNSKITRVIIVHAVLDVGTKTRKHRWSS